MNCIFRTYGVMVVATLIMLLRCGMACAQTEGEAGMSDVDSVAVDSALLAAEVERDSLEVSLLTCKPGNVVYAMYGHSAIRVHDLTDGRDIVFNYGMFNYNEDNFVFKFVKGETDYLLGAEPADFFFMRYGDKGDGVSEQVLNITQDECHRIEELLIENARPENRMYRYNWLYDNCTTRARDLIESAIEGDVVYMASDRQWTARRLLRQFTNADLWVEFGEDLVLGAELDTVLSKRRQMFIPSIFASELDSAVIRRPGGMMIPMVRTTNQPVPEGHPQRVDESRGPFLCFMGLFFMVAGFALFEVNRRRTFKWLDVVLSFLQGAAGLLVAFLFFFSEQAGVDSNIMVLVFNPIALIWIPFYLKRKVKVPAYVTLAELVLWVCAIIAVRQIVSMPIILLAASLLIRVIVNLALNRYNIENKK